jgi:hypothetical protein
MHEATNGPTNVSRLPLLTERQSYVISMHEKEWLEAKQIRPGSNPNPLLYKSHHY